MPYIPAQDEERDPEVLKQFMVRHPLAALITYDGESPQADLIPLIALPADTPSGITLVGHVARNNPLWREGLHDGVSLATFGPAEHYVSPSWYPSKAEHHRVVPTWNYLVVHAWGSLVVHGDSTWVRGVVARLTGHMEAGRDNPWRMGQAPSDYIQGQLANIVGIELLVEKLIGRFKVSAARSEADRLGARDGILADGGGRASDDVAAAMGGANSSKTSNTGHATWRHWRDVGCGIESLHHMLMRAGSSVTLEEVLNEALNANGYDDELGWRHRALVEVAERHGLRGEIRSSLVSSELADGGWWLVSVCAPEQFDCSHLVAVRAVDDRQVRVYWPSAHPEFGVIFDMEPSWFAERMTGRGMRFMPD